VRSSAAIRNPICIDIPGVIPSGPGWRLWHAPARKVRSGRQLVVRILDAWPDARALVRAHRRIALLA